MVRIFFSSEYYFGLGYDLYDDPIGTQSISRMSEHNQLLCNWSKPHLRTELCYNSHGLNPLWAVNW